MTKIKIEEESKYKWYETLWFYSKRFLRAVVPQIPAILAYTSESTIAPYLVLVGGVLTGFDKFCREKGYY